MWLQLVLCALTLAYDPHQRTLIRVVYHDQARATLGLYALRPRETRYQCQYAKPGDSARPASPARPKAHDRQAEHSHARVTSFLSIAASILARSSGAATCLK